MGPSVYMGPLGSTQLVQGLPPSGVGVERYFVYSPSTPFPMLNIYNNWAAMFAAIATLTIGETPVVCIADAGVNPVPLVGMPANGWDMRGGSIRSFYPASGSVALDVPDGAQFDMLLSIENGIELRIAPSAGTGVLNFTPLPDGSGFVFAIGTGSFVANNGLGALVRTRGNLLQTGTYVIALGGASQGAPFTPPSTGPLLELVGDDSAVAAQTTSLGGFPIAPATRWLSGGSAAANLIVITDASGTAPSEWIGPAFAGNTLIFPTARNALSGTTADRALIQLLRVGTTYFDTDLGIPIFWNGVAWIDAAGGLV